MSCPRNRFGPCTKTDKPVTEEAKALESRLSDLMAARQAQDTAFSLPQAQTSVAQTSVAQTKTVTTMKKTQDKAK
jgi:hypothetical protein